MITRTLGKSGISVSGLGMGCWAIGGPNEWEGKQVGWGEVNDTESIRAIHKALDLGVTFFDTANVYGRGRSERTLGEALSGQREQVVIASKFGLPHEDEEQVDAEVPVDRDFLIKCCEASLQRLGTDYIDLYQFHRWDYDIEQCDVVVDTLEELVQAGKIRWYGWSTDDSERVRRFAQGEHCSSCQQHFNLFGGNDETLAACEELTLASVIRGPLGMGILTGKFKHDSKLPENDIRHTWDFESGYHADQLARLEALREVLTGNGRTLAQGALAWLWARSEVTIPIPGFKTVAQVEENAGALEKGSLSSEEMDQVATILVRREF